MRLFITLFTTLCKLFHCHKGLLKESSGAPFLNFQNASLLQFLGLAKEKNKDMPKQCYLNAETLTALQKI